MVSLRLLSSLKQLTRNRLKPVQTGRFHLGLAFSPWRRAKFGLKQHPHSIAIGVVYARDFLFVIPLDHLAVGLIQFAQAPTPPLRPWREKEGRLHAEWTPRLQSGKSCHSITLFLPFCQPDFLLQHVFVIFLKYLHSDDLTWKAKCYSFNA